MVRKDLYDSGELDTVAKMKGRKIGIPCLGCINDFVLTKMLDGAGLSLDDVNLEKMTQPSMLIALENEALEIANLGSPFSEKAKSLGYAVTVQSMHDVVPGFQKGFLMYGPNLLEDNTALGEKFMVAFLKGLRQYGQGKTERNLEIVEKYLMLDRETLMTAPWDPVYPDGRIMAGDILAFQDWSYQNDFMDNKVAEEQLIDSRFIEYANKTLGSSN
jgi:NitT/TauT family transport system substrate-binding protein